MNVSHIGPALVMTAQLLIAMPCALATGATGPALDSLYAAAVEAARTPTPPMISRDLVALVQWNDELNWDGQGRVLMGTFSKAHYFSDTSKHQRGKAFELHGQTWLTAVPMLKHFCAGLGLEGALLRLRIEQRLGLPPAGADNFNDSVIEVWVDPATIFRPCPDPAVTDSECQIGIPGVGLGVERACEVNAAQVSGRFVEVRPTHLGWMCEWRERAYGPIDPAKRYPWTALGYTYDWHDPRDPIGESEFVAPARTEVIFDSVTPIDTYCGR